MRDARRHHAPRPRRRRASRRRPARRSPTGVSASSTSAAGHQPLSQRRRQRSGSTFNGEIYNHADLRARARSRAATATARSPTPKPSSTPTKSGATSACNASAACSRLRSGMRRAAPAAGARPAGRQAALLGASRRPAALRIGNQSAFWRAASSQREANEAVLPEVLARATPRARETMFRGHSQAASRPPARLRGRQRRHPSGTGTFRCGRPRAARRRCESSRRAIPRTARGIRAAAADERRAARHVPLRRHRQQRDRRADGAR